MNRRRPFSYDPRFSFPWGPFYPPGHVPQKKSRDAVVKGLRPTNRSTTSHHPIAPINPFPPDPYINQLKLSEALQTGTLFQWLHTPYGNEQGDATKEVSKDSTEKETNEAEDSPSKKPAPGSTP
ncbi:hypothetical protein AN963_22840 [Brevibacillus choshinensis]|uniref:Uncharacterized protein n=1 Tax=Brevibacillus choshinensis TaxID=54911 RepID=A0ABR5N1A6_BRECH|nr:hypothetical protein [Brevibacillus choshinensis]KQL44260.1 hypothetical protein AN963_22840 [Brevibacillus choshinensis]